MAVTTYDGGKLHVGMRVGPSDAMLVQILKEIGYSDNEIARLRARRVV